MNFDSNDNDIMTQVHNILSGLVEVVPEEGDYTQDGILYCGKCNTPRQMITPGDEEKRLVNVECRCRMEANELRRQREKAENKQRRIESARLSGMDAEAYMNMRFDVDDGHNREMSDLCKKYVKDFDMALSKNLGLIFSGDVGGGKTFYACCIANALIDSGEYTAVVTSFSQIMADMQQDFGKNRAAVLKRIKECDLLVIDDLGAERSSDYALETKFDIVNTRILSNKPMIITTNLTMQQLQNLAALKDRRIYDRLKCCRPIEVKGPSRRDTEAKKADQVLRQIMQS